MADMNVVWFILGLFIGFLVGRAFGKLWASPERKVLNDVVQEKLFDKHNKKKKGL